MAERKLDALRAQASQIDGFHQMVDDEAALRDLIVDEYFRDLRPDDWP